VIEGNILRGRVSAALGREADLIDTHSFLWTNRKTDLPGSEDPIKSVQAGLTHLIINLSWQADYWQSSHTEEDRKLECRVTNPLRVLDVYRFPADASQESY
jgi:hypothetical protein